MNRMVLAESELYAPREASFERLVAVEGGAVKLSLVAAGPISSISASTVDAAVEQITHTAPGHFGAGFAVLHHGEMAVWLLVHWWLEGGIASRALWRADIATPDAFRPADDTLMACVWELGVIDFERRAWMETAMAGRPIADYFDRTLSRSTV